MADTDARILEMVRKELEKDRAAKTEDLFAKAQKIDPAVSKLTIRQFHAKYPLQIKRAMKRGGDKRAPRKTAGRKRAGRRAAKGATAAKKTTKRVAKKATGKRARKTTATRSATKQRRGRRAGAAAAVGGVATRGDVRGLLLQFAKQVAVADGKAEMVDVLAGIDSWVDRMVSAATR